MEFKYKCDQCGAERMMPIPDDEWKACKDLGIHIHVDRWNIRCPSCCRITFTTIQRHREAKAKTEVKVQLNEKIRTWIPVIYQDSDTSRYPQNIWQTHKHWVPGPKGLLLYGDHRTFKSRIAYSIAMHHAQIGTVMECYDPRSFRAMIERRIGENSLWKWYEHGALSPFFLLDDLGKFKGEGRRIEEEIFNLIKLRHEARLGMIVTTNFGDERLAATFSPSIGIAIVERLREMSTAIPFGSAASLTEESQMSHGLRNADL